MNSSVLRLPLALALPQACHCSVSSGTTCAAWQFEFEVAGTTGASTATGTGTPGASRLELSCRPGQLRILVTQLLSCPRLTRQLAEQPGGATNERRRRRRASCQCRPLAGMANWQCVRMTAAAARVIDAPRRHRATLNLQYSSTFKYPDTSTRVLTRKRKKRKRSARA